MTFTIYVFVFLISNAVLNPDDAQIVYDKDKDKDKEFFNLNPRVEIYYRGEKLLPQRALPNFLPGNSGVTDRPNDSIRFFTRACRASSSSVGS